MTNDLCIWLHRWAIKMCLVFDFQRRKFNGTNKKKNQILTTTET